MKSIQLIKVHKHQGKQLEAGDIIQVSNPVADWLVKNNIGKAVAASASPSKSADKKESVKTKE